MEVCDVVWGKLVTWRYTGIMDRGREAGSREYNASSSPPFTDYHLLNITNLEMTLQILTKCETPVHKPFTSALDVSKEGPQPSLSMSPYCATVQDNCHLYTLKGRLLYALPVYSWRL